MFKVSIKSLQNVETNAAEFKSVPECESWVKENHDYFPEGYTSQIINIAQILKFEQAKRKGLKNQNIGREVLAIIYAINDEKTNLGLLTQENLSALLNDPTLKVIERLLLNGSLGSATQLITNVPDSYFSAENKQLILDYINANK
jgi:hypothetical protein